MKRLLCCGILALALPLGTLFAPPLHHWTASFHDAYCLGPCCLVSDGFIEISCWEYTPGP